MNINNNDGILYVILDKSSLARYAADTIKVWAESGKIHTMIIKGEGKWNIAKAVDILEILKRELKIEYVTSIKTDTKNRISFGEDNKTIKLSVIEISMELKDEF